MFAYIFVVLAVIIRLVPHPFHLTPVGAALLYFGARRSRKEMIVPIVLLGLSDVYLTKVHYGLALGPEHLLSVIWYAVAMMIGYLLVRKTDPLRVIGASLASAISFFVVSNFGVWMFGTMYPKSWAGLVQCYVMAVPFFRGTLASDLIFTPVLFTIPLVFRALERHLSAGKASAA
jgi:hypothetical protein